MAYTPFKMKGFPKHSDLHKKKSIPQVGYQNPNEYDDTNLDAEEDAKGVSNNSDKKVIKGKSGDTWKNRHAVKSDAKKKVEERKKEVAAMSKEELAAEQKRLNDRKTAFDKSRTSSLPFMGNLKIEKVSKNSINVPNINKNNNTEAFMNPPYRDPNGTGPRIKRKGHHGWKKTD